MKDNKNMSWFHSPQILFLKKYYFVIGVTILGILFAGLAVIFRLSLSDVNALPESALDQMIYEPFFVSQEKTKIYTAEGVQDAVRNEQLEGLKAKYGETAHEHQDEVDSEEKFDSITASVSQGMQLKDPSVYADYVIEGIYEGECSYVYNAFIKKVNVTSVMHAKNGSVKKGDILSVFDEFEIVSPVQFPNISSTKQPTITAGTRTNGYTMYLPPMQKNRRCLFFLNKLVKTDEAHKEHVYYTPAPTLYSRIPIVKSAADFKIALGNLPEEPMDDAVSTPQPMGTANVGGEHETNEHEINKKNERDAQDAFKNLPTYTYQQAQSFDLFAAGEKAKQEYIHNALDILKHYGYLNKE